MAENIGIPQITAEEALVQIQVRVLHKWKPYKDVDLYSYLLVDRSGNGIQATFSSNEEADMDNLITVGKCYVLDRYACKHALTVLRVTAHPASIKLSKNDLITELEDDHTIPDYYFDFYPFKNLKLREGIHRILTDVIGKVDDLERVETTASNSLVRIKLRDMNDDIVMVALWQEIAATVDIESLAATDKPVIAAIAGLKVVPFHSNNTSTIGAIQLQSCSGTRICINPEIDLAREMATRFRGTATPDRVRFTPKISERNRVTLTTLYEQDMKALKDEKFTCVATSTRLTPNRNWFYASCEQCKVTLSKQLDGYSCPKHGDVFVKYTFCVNCTIEDAEGLADITLFEQAMAAIVGVSCADMVKTQGHSNAAVIPDTVKAIVGLKKNFQVKKSDKLYKNNIQFVVNKVFDLGDHAESAPTSAGASSSIDAGPSADKERDMDRSHAKRNILEELENADGSPKKLKGKDAI